MSRRVKARDLVDAIADEMGLCDFDSLAAVVRGVRKAIGPRVRVVEVENPDLAAAASDLVRVVRRACEDERFDWSFMADELFDLELALGEEAR